MENVKFVQMQKENKDHYKLLESLMIPYHMELNAHKLDPMITEEFLRKIARSSIDMQGDHDRHLELCYSDNNLIGFLYGKVDHEDHKGHKKPGFGYIMEFYVKPEYRRSGFGKAMFQRIESLFAIDGAKRMYLNTGTEAGIAFWTGLGFSATDEIQTDNNMPIWEKAISPKRCENIRVNVTQYLTPDMLQEIASRQGENKERSLRGLTNVISRAKWYSNHFNIIAKNEFGNIIGSAGFIQSETEPNKWFYTDLWVDVEYRRRDIATQIVKNGLEHLSDIGARTVYCTVDPENHPSLMLQKKIGFFKISIEPFNEMCLEGVLMFKMDVPQKFNCIPLEPDNFHIGFVCDILTSKRNAETLHTKKIQPNGGKEFFQKMKTALQEYDPDEANFIIRKGIVPVAWLKINGLQSQDTAWISMLVVHEKFQNQGIGSFAVHFTEEFAKSKGKKAVSIHTNVDNIAAQNLYKKLGYTITEENECTNGDGEKRRGLTFYRDHLDAVEMCIDGKLPDILMLK